MKNVLRDHVTLFKHLRAEKRLLPYAKFLLGKHKALLAYLLLALVSFWALTLGLKSASADRDALLRSAKRAVMVGCEADRANAVALRAALDGQIRFVRRANEPPPPTVEQRVDAINTLKASIEIPDCAKRVSLLNANG